LAPSEADTRRLAVHLLFVIVLAAVVAGCSSSAEDGVAEASPGMAPSTATPATTTTPAPAPATVSPTTTTAPRYGLLGEQVAVSESALGTVTWWQVPSIPLELLETGGIPSPGHNQEHRWPALYKSAHTVTGACFDIYEETLGYLGLGPCPETWAPWATDQLQPEATWGGPRGWSADISEWIWLKEVWFSPDGESWDRAADAFPDATAAVEAQPWSVAERDGRWVVIGATGVTEAADGVPDEWVFSDVKGLRVRRNAQPAAWASEDLATWSLLPVDFSEVGTNTHITSVIAGDAGWAIFGIRSSQKRPWLAEWVAWASTDGSRWDELPMTGIYDTPCEPILSEYCGMIKAHMTEGAIVVYAWTWPVPNEWSEGADWRLFIGEL
jgi:hypothetical protein